MQPQRFFQASLIALAISACSPAEPPKQHAEPAGTSAMASQSESERLAAFFAQSYKEDLQRSPMTQSYRGLKWDYGKWDDVSEQAAEREAALYTQRLSQVAQFDMSQLSEQEKLSLTLYRLDLERKLANDKFRHHSYIMDQFSAWHTLVPSFLINIHRITDSSDANAYVARLDAVKPLFEQVIEQLKIREKLGVFPPKWSYDQMVVASQNVISGAPFDDTEANSTIWNDFSTKLDALNLPEADKQSLLDAAKRALLEKVKPAYELMIAELKHQQALSPAGDGVWRLPDGDSWYDNRLNWFTTTDLNAEQVHQLGLENVQRIHQQMRQIMKKVNFEGDLPAFFEFMRTDPQFYYPNTDEGRAQYLSEAKKLIDIMGEQLPDYFGLIPQSDMIVKRVEAFREKSAGKAFYQSPAQDGSRPGIYYANLYDMNNMPIYQMEALAYHEGIPGHHMQRAITQELQGIPDFQKYASFTAYTEGWGLYTEELAKDMGFYQDPYSDFGRLAMELWRACRLVVDTGMHSKKWSREQAIQYLLDNTPNPKGDVVKAIERYIAMPGQATAYMVGKLKIMQLRQEAMDELGDKFDFRGFHDEVLKNGPLPLNLLEANVKTWVAKQKV
ncbi:DUF885 domain-containing protein [Bowmanella pacifica]|uniref:DUF885 domain-containing protein n=2 Tax=Bowmanella TaxID=366580 RepID=A0A917Z5Q0_9ALTE|nr:DUF885 domain-containing protein [Bowmanella pacifica]GGO73540.1 hypothetical protein GCM10010982_34270 [Bowmanella pacifica]